MKYFITVSDENDIYNDFNYIFDEIDSNYQTYTDFTEDLCLFEQTYELNSKLNFDEIKKIMKNINAAHIEIYDITEDKKLYNIVYIENEQSDLKTTFKNYIFQEYNNVIDLLEKYKTVQCYINADEWEFTILYSHKLKNRLKLMFEIHQYIKTNKI